jgi:two-component system response regulator AgrA
MYSKYTSKFGMSKEKKIMLEVMICEDNEVHRSKLKQLVENTILREKLDLKVAICTENPKEIISYIEENNSTGIYILDVDLKNEINGIKLGEKN